MGSMHTGLEEAGNATERLAAFYAERARADVALIVTGGNAPNAEGRLGLGDHGEAGNDHAAIARSVTSKDRKSVVSGTRVSVRVDLGGRRILKKKNTPTKTKHTPT